MNDPISWDPALVKKFSSSNHYKLINQLRNEVKKYPLNNKKKSSLIQSIDNNQEDKNQSKVSHTYNSSLTKDPNKINDSRSIKSTVSFNNAKNFSIYNQTITSNEIIENEIDISVKSNSNVDCSSQTFKERLNKIDMK
tara:strand:+ start:2443 stop:2856 length:414 start_codon:yes stop_codon:yes gene_type:complete